MFRTANLCNRIGLTALLLALLSGCAQLPEENAAPELKPLVFPAPPDSPRFVFERTILSSADVVEDEKEARLRRALTGETRTGEGMAKPYAVAVHQGRIFVSDTAERVVKVFDVPQGRFFRIGTEGAGTLVKPLGLDVAADGTLFVADATAKSIMVYDRDGRFLRKLGEREQFQRLSSVTVDAKGEKLYVVDIGGVDSDKHRLRVLSAKDGQLIQDIGKRGKENGEFNLPRDAALGKDGRIYVVDGGNFRVQVFDQEGKFVKTFGTVGKQLGNFARPKEVASDREGNVYVVDSAFGNFQIFNPEGELLMFVGDRSERDGPALYMLPSGIFVDEDGRVYMVDQWYRKVDVFRPYELPADKGFLVARPKKAAGDK